MTFELKALSPDAVPRALEKAERYRLLSEPGEAESICLDVLEVEPANQDAIVTMILALTEQFETESAVAVGRARTAIERLEDAYARAYYTGILLERRAKAELRHGTRLAPKPRGEILSIRELRMEDLDRHHPVHLRLLRLVDGTHPPRSDPLQDPEIPVQDLATDERIVRAGLNHDARDTRCVLLPRGYPTGYHR